MIVRTDVLLDIDASRPEAAPAFERIEMWPVLSAAVSTRQVPTSECDGPLVVLAGQFRLPPMPAEARHIPAVVLVHGSDGITASLHCWADEIVNPGAAAFLPDCFR
jgi:hypothetical protein